MKPRPTRYNGAILKKLAVFLRTNELFRLQLGRSKEGQRLRCVGNFTKAEWKQWLSGNGQWGSGNGLWLANCPSASQKSFLSSSGHSTRLTLEGWSFFTFSRDAGRKKTVLAEWEASLKQSGSCDVRERAVASLPSAA